MIEHLADVWIRPASNSTYTTGAGRKLAFSAGYARAADEPSVVWALRNPACTVAPTARYRDALPRWIQLCGPIMIVRATIVDYAAPEEAAPEDEPPAVVFGAMTTRGSTPDALLDPPAADPPRTPAAAGKGK